MYACQIGFLPVCCDALHQIDRFTRHRNATVLLLSLLSLDNLFATLIYAAKLPYSHYST